jgi:nucleoside-diphosphate-sugar epimerase
MSAAGKPTVLILGGCGFVGRNLVAMLVHRGLCSSICVIDKRPPSMGFFAPPHQEVFDSPVVTFKQGDLSRDAAVAKVFEGASFDFVFNLTFDGVPFGQPDEVYEQCILAVATKCGAAAAKAGVRRFIDLSTAQVYDPGEKASTEGSKLKPWTKPAAFKLRAEEALRATAGLPLTVLRPAVIYGPGDTQGLSPRLLCAASYQQLGEKMRFMWDSSLRIHTVTRDDA